MRKKTARRWLWLSLGLTSLTIALLVTAGFKKVPPEVAQAKAQVALLWSSEAAHYLPKRCDQFRADYRQVVDRWEKEQQKWIWFRKYDPLARDFTGICDQVLAILKEMAVKKQLRAQVLEKAEAIFRDKVSTLRRFTLTINEGRLARRDLTRAELLLAQSQRTIKQGLLDKAEQHQKDADKCLNSANKSLSRVLNRYRRSDQMAQWGNLMTDTISESHRRHTLAVVVSKIERKLFVYRNGNLIHTYVVGLGRNGLNDKLHSGDQATPEGHYKINKKNPNSLYFKALLLDYPNSEDRLAYQHARKRGLIPPRMGIGSLIEIHGGGITFMTRGCIALENDEMNTLYNLLPLGTPVTIVGSTEQAEHLFPDMEGIPSGQD